MNKKNILELCLSPDLGGLELCVNDYFQFFKTQMNSFICVASNKKLDNYVDDANKITLKRNKFFPVIPAKKLAKFIDENEIDIIHFHWTKDITTVVLAKVLAKRKVFLLQSRHMTMTRFKDDFYHKWLYKNIDVIHAVTQQVKEQLQKFIPQSVQPKLEMVYLGVSEVVIDKEIVNKLKEKDALGDAFIVGIVGRIEEAKGQSLLIDALSQLKALHIKALIVGHTMDDSYLNGLKARVIDLGLDNNVIFTGFTKNINEYFQLCDVSVLATKKETFGLVVIESMLNKVPVIAVNNGGPLEIIDDGQDSLFFDRTAEDLAKKITLLYEDKELKNNLSVNGYKKIKYRFDKETQMQKMLELVNES